VFVALFTMHGSNYLVRKVSNGIAERAQKAAFTFWMAATFLTVLFLGWTFFNTDILTKPGINGLLPAILATISLLCSGWLIRAKKTGWAFVTGSLTIVFATAMVFMGLYPRLLVSSLDPSFSLTISNASSSPYTLKVMTIVAAIFVPIVLVYQAWTYRIFRKRVNTNPEDLTY
jgi:cytochrome d ubiquinol oxidase subunit II